MRERTIGASYRTSGIACPVCGSARSVVYDTRKGPGTVKRFRQCVFGHRFRTDERLTRPIGRARLDETITNAIVDAIDGLGGRTI